MKTVLVLLLVLLLSLSEGGEQVEVGGCTNGDLCHTLLGSQLSLDNIASDVGNLTDVGSQLQKSTEEMKILKEVIKKNTPPPITTFQQKDLEECYTELEDLHSTTDDLIRVHEELVSEDEGWQDEMTKLYNERDRLLKSKRELEIEKRPFYEESTQLKNQIWNLTLEVYTPVDCADIQLQGYTESDIYAIHPYYSRPEDSIKVLCDLESNEGAWTVFFTRQPQGEPVDFDRSWNEFKNGFGNVTSEFWMGNDLLHLLTSQKDTMLRIDAEDYKGTKRSAEWSVFKVADEDNKYRLTLDGYQKNSTMGDSLSENNNSFFTTVDRDNDINPDFNCATGPSGNSLWGRGGWWYSQCGSARLTAPLRNTNYWNSASYGNWDVSGQRIASLKRLSMKFRRVNYYKELAIDM